MGCGKGLEGLDMNFEEIRMVLGFAFLGLMFWAGMPRKKEWF